MNKHVSPKTFQQKLTAVMVITLAILTGAITNLVATPLRANAAVTVAVPPGTELDFSATKRTSAINQTTLNGTAYYTNVLTVGSVQIDAKITTVALSNATIDNYDNPGSASGNQTYFQINNTASSPGGYTAFKFEFFNHADSTLATLENVKLTSIDLDSPGRQFTEFNGFNRFVLNNPTNLSPYTTDANGNALADGLVRFTATRTTSPGSHSNIADDAVEVDFDSINTYVVVFGNEEAQSGYFGVAFMGLCDTITSGCIPATAVGSPQMTNYTITYNGNTNTSGTAPNSYTGNGTATLGTNLGSLVRTGYTFNGWNTTADGTGTHYAVGGSYNLTANVTLYAEWTPVAASYTITFDGNGNTGGTAPAVITGSGYKTLRTNSGSLLLTNYTFKGWNTAANGSGTHYAVATSYNLTADVTLYAEWTLTPAVIYNGNGSTGGNTPNEIPANTTITIDPNTGNLIRSGYRFLGWNTSPNGTGTHYAAGMTPVLPVGTVLYAEWEAIDSLASTGSNYSDEILSAATLIGLGLFINALAVIRRRKIKA